MNVANGSVIQLRAETYQALRAHLLPRPMRAEEAAFLFAKVTDDDGALAFAVIDWYPVPATGFATRSLYYLELTDETRAFVIKKAHDLGCSLIEAHSHAGDSAAAFSPSDRRGFEEFVPHVLWRLKGRPYAAIVMTTQSADALAWRRPDEPVQITTLTVDDGSVISTTRFTLSASHDDLAN